MTANKPAHDIAVEINTVLAKDLQANLRCAICCSTLKNPVVPSCNHPFCKECIDSCFYRKTQIECPMCRQQIKKRSCVPSESLNSIVQAYLQLARAFKRDVAETTIHIPKENIFLESQAILSTQTDSPMRDFVLPKAPLPIFARPRPKRKQLGGPSMPAKLSKLEEENEDDEPLPDKKESENISSILGVKRPATSDDELGKTRSVEVLNTHVHAEVQCNLNPDLADINIRSVIDTKRKAEPNIETDIEALFSILPGIVSILMKDEEQEALCRILNLRLAKDVSPSQIISNVNNAKESNLTDKIRYTQQKKASISLEKKKASETNCELDSATYFSEASNRDLKSKAGGSSNLSDSGSLELGDALDYNVPAVLTRLTDSRETPRRATSFNAPRKFSDYNIEAGNSGDQECVPGTPCSITPVKDYDDNKENKFDDSFAAEVTLRLGDPSTPTVSTPRNNSTPIFEFSSAKRRQSYVLCLSRLENQADEELLHEFRIAFPTIQINDDVTSNVTHLVMMNSQQKQNSVRSLKHSFAIARCCEVLGRLWLEDCLKNGRLLPTASYTLKATSQSQLTAVQRARTSKTPLFKGKKFLLPPRFSNHHLVNREKLGELIELCGGEVITKLWDCHPPDTYIIFAPDSKEHDVARRYEFDTKVPVLNADWILESVCEFRIVSPFDKFRVYSSLNNTVVRY